MAAGFASSYHPGGQHRTRRNLRSNRSLQRRRGSEEENVHIDFSRPMSDIVEEVLVNVVKRTDVSKPKKLGYLNCIPKLCKHVEKTSDFGFTLDEIFRCLRVALFHEACEVRAAGLRAVRYLLRDAEAAESVCRNQLSHFIARSLDVELDNRLERMQAIRLIRKLLAVHPTHFPRCLTSCLVAIVRDTSQDKEIFFRSSLAILCEIALMNPSSCVDVGGLAAILRGILSDYQQPQCGEAALGVLLCLLNDPKTRVLAERDLTLENLLAPLTDYYYCFAPEIVENSQRDSSGNVTHLTQQQIQQLREDRENRIFACKLAISSVLHSWPGLFYLCRPESTGLQSLIGILHLPYMDTRNHILDLLFDVFCLPLPDRTDDFSAAILSADPSVMQDTWQLYEGFVAAEGRDILPHVALCRANMVENYLALLLWLLINAGVLEALVEVIVSSDDHLSIKATVLLGQMLHLASRFFPPDCSHPCLSLPSLVMAASSPSICPDRRNKANEALSHLHAIHTLKKRGPMPSSLFLDQLLQLCSPWAKRSGFIDGSVSRSRLRQCLKKDTELTLQAIKDTQVVTLEHHSWDWDLIGSILKWPGDTLRKLEDGIHRQFVRNLLAFYKPQSKLFSTMELDREGARQVCLVGCHLLDFLLEADETKAFELLDEFLSDLKLSLSEITSEVAPAAALFSPSRMVSTVCQTYFLFLGRLSSSSKGRRLLEKTGTFQHLLDLVSISTHDTYAKLIVSSLDYTKDDFCRKVLVKVLTSASEASRLYATNYLRVLLRAKVTDFRKWALELLVTQLYDGSRAVFLAAADILDEACDLQENLEALWALRPSLLHLGDRGLLLSMRFLSIAAGFRHLRDTNLLDHEIDRWKKVYCLKYVKMVDDVLNEGLTRHQRGEDGAYGRRSSNMRQQTRPAYIPPHAYGQLARHSEGTDYLVKSKCLAPWYDIIEVPDISTDSGILHLKAALWVAGHVGSCPIGFSEVFGAGVIPYIVELASSCPVYTIRGVCFYALGLLASTPDGAEVLSLHGWETVKRNQQESWPVVRDLSDMVKASPPHAFFRPHTFSTGSTDSHLSDYYYYADPLGFPSLDGDQVSMMGDTYRLSSSFCGSFSHAHPPGTSAGSFRSQTLPRGYGLSPYLQHQQQHQRSSSDTKELQDALRPRSSSDSQSADPDTRHLVAGFSSANPIWLSDQPQIVAARSDKDVHFGGRDEEGHRFAKPSSLKLLSEDPSASKAERSDSNESCRTTISAGSKSDGCPHAFGAHRTLSPMGSGGIGGSHWSHVYGRQFSFGGVSWKGSLSTWSPTTPEVGFSFTTARDAMGYVALRAIQNHRRVHSLSLGEDNRDSDDPYGLKASSSLRFSKAKSLDRYVKPPTHGFDMGIFDERSVRSRKSSASSSDPPDIPVSSRAQSPDASEDQQRYIGLCLPVDACVFFCLPPSSEDAACHECPLELKVDDDASRSESTLPELPKTPTIFEDWSKFHNRVHCIACCTSVETLSVPKVEESKPLLLVSGDESTNPAHQHEDMRATTPQRSPILLRSRAADGASDSNPSVESGENVGDGAIAPPLPSSSSLTSVRKEVLRLVSNLNNVERNLRTPAERGLLNLKQKFPDVFQDVCLYSEVSLQMEKYSFRLLARRFVQELFLDMSFEQLFQEAESILKIPPAHKTVLPTSPEMDV